MSLGSKLGKVVKKVVVSAAASGKDFSRESGLSSTATKVVARAKAWWASI